MPVLVPVILPVAVLVIDVIGVLVAENASPDVGSVFEIVPLLVSVPSDDPPVDRKMPYVAPVMVAPALLVIEPIPTPLLAIPRPNKFAPAPVASPEIVPEFVIDPISLSARMPSPVAVLPPPPVVVALAEMVPVAELTIEVRTK